MNIIESLLIRPRAESAALFLSSAKVDTLKRLIQEGEGIPEIIAGVTGTKTQNKKNGSKEANKTKHRIL